MGIFALNVTWELIGISTINKTRYGSIISQFREKNANVLETLVSSIGLLSVMGCASAYGRYICRNPRLCTSLFLLLNLNLGYQLTKSFDKISDNVEAEPEEGQNNRSGEPAVMPKLERYASLLLQL